MIPRLCAANFACTIAYCLDRSGLVLGLVFISHLISSLYTSPTELDTVLDLTNRLQFLCVIGLGKRVSGTGVIIRKLRFIQPGLSTYAGVRFCQSLQLSNSAISIKSLLSRSSRLMRCDFLEIQSLVGHRRIVGFWLIESWLIGSWLMIDWRVLAKIQRVDPNQRDPIYQWMLFSFTISSALSPWFSSSYSRFGQCIDCRSLVGDRKGFFDPQTVSRRQWMILWFNRWQSKGTVGIGLKDRRWWGQQRTDKNMSYIIDELLSWW